MAVTLRGERSLSSPKLSVTGLSPRCGENGCPSMASVVLSAGRSTGTKYWPASREKDKKEERERERERERESG